MELCESCEFIPRTCWLVSKSILTMCQYRSELWSVEHSFLIITNRGELFVPSGLDFTVLIALINFVFSPYNSHVSGMFWHCYGVVY
jgi:hypothetical protein